MSRFFRSTASSSSSSSGSADEATVDDEETQEGTQEISPFEISEGADQAAESTLSTIGGPPSSTYANHRDFLLHALLEERCTNDVLASYNHLHVARRPRRNSPEVRNQARVRYQRLCAQLASIDLISTGLEVEQYATTRQRYRDGLDVLTQQRSTTTRTVSPQLRRLLTDTSAMTEAESSRAATLQPAAVPDPSYFFRELAVIPQPLRKLLEGPTRQPGGPWMPIEESLERQMSIQGTRQSRYQHEFEELRMLGQGGFGVVYHVRHRLDGQCYAVKKVPLSNARLRQIEAQGQAEIDAMLSEMRTLARLDHPNIVRYYNGWIDTYDVNEVRNVTEISGLGDTTMQGSVLGEAQTTSDLSRSTTVEDQKGDDEEEAKDDAEEDDNQDEEDDIFEIDHSPTDIFEESWNKNRTQRRRKRSPSWQGGISLSVPPNSVFDSGEQLWPNEAPRRKWPYSLALHMQMSVHPMTLADFISPVTDDSRDPTTAPPLCHCFHDEPSVAILNAILDGVEYLHSEGLAHRDIKPSNIFLGRRRNPRRTEGTVDLMRCTNCRDAGVAAPILLEVRIGDFGLVSLASPDVQQSADVSAHGTKLYRPPAGTWDGQRLDLYALGLIFLELLFAFHTNMERIKFLSTVKEEDGWFPRDSANRGVHRWDGIQNCVRAMMSNDQPVASIATIRELVRNILSPASAQHANPRSSLSVRRRSITLD